MRQYTTPTYRIGIDGVNLSNYDVYVVFEQGNRKIEQKASNIEYENNKSTFIVSLSQKNTALFKEDKPIDVQVNWADSSSKRNATIIKQINTDKNILRKEIRG